MRTRRSRFFVILLHVVGVSRHSTFLTCMEDEEHVQQQQLSTISERRNHTTATITNLNENSNKNTVIPPNSIWALRYVDYYEEYVAPYHSSNEKKKRNYNTYTSNRKQQQQQQQPTWRSVLQTLLLLRNPQQREYWEKRLYDTTTMTTTTTTDTTINDTRRSSGVVVVLDVIQDVEVVERIPIWIQDSYDGLCLGPTNTFIECGDTTLWYTTIVSLKQQHQHRSSSSSSSSSSSKTTQIAFTFRVYDHDFLIPTTTSSSNMDDDDNKDNDSFAIGTKIKMDNKSHRSNRRRRKRRSSKPPNNKKHLQAATAECLATTVIDTNQPQHDNKNTTTSLSAFWNNISIQVRSGNCYNKNNNNRMHQRQHQQSFSSSAIWILHSNHYLQPYYNKINNKNRNNNNNIKNDMKRQRNKWWQLPIGHSRNREIDDEPISPSQLVNDEQAQLPCISREYNTNRAIITNCAVPSSNNNNNINDQNHNNSRPVQFVFVRYHAVPITTTSHDENQNHHKIRYHYHNSNYDNTQQQHGQPLPNNQNIQKTTTTSSLGTPARSTMQQQEQPSLHETIITTNLPSNRDRVHQQAILGGGNQPLMHPELKIATRLIFNTNMNNNNNDKTEQKIALFKPSIFNFEDALSDTNPILLASSLAARNNKKNDKKPSMIHNSMNDIDNKATKLRRMQTHPYLNEAKNGVWTDPQTNLAYQTDLCRYLDRNQQEHGRHTLTGFGIYRKGYVIKVYGIAYYVSKRDVLMDPILLPYAMMTAEQLRQRPEFYEILRTMRNPSSSSSSTQKYAGYFDRTIMLRTNMQLSTETMRSSLEADWRYLTDEAKRTLVDASMQQQTADDAMLEFIQSPENPNRCSCSQIAPPEYKSNPDCCARGTELVFTWTKANELEVRLNGRLMAIFPRPDIAEGIFYEYLRLDNPISPEFVDRVVDGFPFLLSPLAQVKGVKMGQSSTSNKEPVHENGMFHAMIGFRDFVISQTIEVSDIVKQSMFDSVEHAGNMAKVFSASASEFVREADRRRDLMVKHTVAAPEVLMKLLARDEDTIQYFVRWISGQSEPEIVEDNEINHQIPIPRGPRGRIFGYPLSRWFGEDIYYSPDEIEPMMINPTINRAILTLVHLYLLLLFIVSFPGSYTTRTRLLHRKHVLREPMDDSESDSSYDNVSNTTRNNVDDNDSEPSLLLQQYDEKLRSSSSSPDKLKYPSHRNGNHIFPRTCLPIHTTNHIDICSRSSGNSGLKKKSLSYFL